MAWTIENTWWIIFYNKYSRLFWIYIKKLGEKTFSPSIRIYVTKIEYRTTFKIKIGHYLKLLTPETVKFLGSTKNKITKNKNGENVPKLEFTEGILVHYNIVNNNYQQNSIILPTLFLINRLVNYLIFYPKMLYI